MKIIGTGRANPAKIVTNAMLEEFLDTSDEWIRERTGMTERHVISNEKLEDLAAEAARKAIEDAGITPEDIDYIICSNVVNEYITPGLSCIIQGAIGAKCACVDVNAACSGFIYALDMADDRIKSDCLLAACHIDHCPAAYRFDNSFVTERIEFKRSLRA